jgi:NADH-quinone oxidoreductase subunit B
VAVKNDAYDHPFFQVVERMPGLDVVLGKADDLLHWGAENSLWIFPLGTSCCAIEFMATAAGRMDLDRIGTIVRGSPRQCDVMVVAGTITVKMAPRVKKLWDQMPEPKWSIAMGSCAISGDFYRDIYSVVPGIDTFMPVDVYVPGCPPSPDALVDGIRRLQEKIRASRAGTAPQVEARPETAKQIRPAIRRLCDPDRDPAITQEQLDAVLRMDKGGAERRRP